MGTRRRSRVVAKPKEKPLYTFSLPCGENRSHHEIHVYKDGRIDLSAHAPHKVPLHILAQEFEMGTKRRATCQAFAAAMLAMKDTEILENPLNKALAGVLGGDYREIAYVAMAKREERISRHQFIDPYAVSLKNRALSSSTLAERAVQTLDTCTFRTTTTYQHTVVLSAVRKGRTSFLGSASAITGATRKNKKNCFIKRHSVVKISLNLPRWAKVLRLCGGYVDDYAGGNILRHFIYEIFKVKSDNELYVHIMKQSAGYTLRPVKAVIRRGHDGIWRVHSWPVEWP